MKILTRDETGKVEFGRDSAFRRDYETQAMNYPSDAQEAAIYGMGRIIADAKAGKPLNTGNLATLQVNPERLHSKAPQPRPTVVA